VQSSVTPSRERQQLQQATLLHQAHRLMREAHGRAAARAGAPTDAAGPNAADTAHSAHATHVGPARGRADTGPPALSTPSSPQAILLHQAHHLLREAHQRAAAKAGAPTAAAQLGHAALTGDQDRDYFSQVQGDLAAGNFGGALDLLDRHWPTSAHMPGMQEARASIAHVIVARLHATLVPLTMDRMLHMLQPVRDHGYLDEVLTGGHRLRDLLLAAASGLDRDRLASPRLRPDSLSGGQAVGPHPSPPDVPKMPATLYHESVGTGCRAVVLDVRPHVTSP